MSDNNRSRGRGNQVGAWKYAVLSYEKLIAEVSSISVLPWDQLMVSWTDGNSTEVKLNWDEVKIPKPDTVAETDAVIKMKAKMTDDIQNAVIEEGDLVPKVYGFGSKRFKEEKNK